MESRESDPYLDPTLDGLNQDLVRVEEEIESDFASMPPSEAAPRASARLREYETRLQKASLFFRSRILTDGRRQDR